MLLAACLGLIGTPAGRAEETVRAEREPYAPKLLKQGDVIRHPVWGVEITIPGFEYWDEEGMNVQPNFVLAASSEGACLLHLSMFAEPTREPVSPPECRTHYAGDPARVRGLAEARFIRESTEPVTYTRFDQQVEWKGQRALSNQLYGYWTRGVHCFELHVSAIECPGFDAQAMPILESVRIGPDTGATVATIRVAMRDGGDPRDWQNHLTAAMDFLFSGDPAFWWLRGYKEAGMKMTRASGIPPPDPVTARRFLRAALDLGGASIGPATRVVIELEMSSTYYLEGDLDGGLPHEEAALALARKLDPPDEELVRRITLGVAMTRTDAGRPEAACDIVKKYFLGLDPAGRERVAHQIKEEKALASLRRNRCYRALRKELGL